MKESGKCSAYSCRNITVGSIDRYPGATYCFPHLKALEAMNEKRRPKPRVVYFAGFEQITEVASQARVPTIKSETGFRSSEAENADGLSIEKPNEPVNWVQTYLGAEKQKRKTMIRKWTLILLPILVIGGVAQWQDSIQDHKKAVNELKARNLLATKCFQISDEENAAKAGNVGTPARNEAVVKFYDHVLKSTCVEWGDGTLTSNPFFGIDTKSDMWSEFINAAQYTAGRWNAQEPFVLRCADGWNSPSIGMRGACSHHGGVVSGFNENKSWNLASHLGTESVLYPPLSKLQEAAMN